MYYSSYSTAICQNCLVIKERHHTFCPCISTFNVMEHPQNKLLPQDSFKHHIRHFYTQYVTFSLLSNIFFSCLLLVLYYLEYPVKVPVNLLLL